MAYSIYILIILFTGMIVMLDMHGQCVVYIMNRDMKLENVLMAADGLKIADYSTAICLDLTMKLSFSCCMCVYIYISASIMSVILYPI